ncbi:MAG: ABC transporter permease subunit [Clostridiales bacterium]|nr:ABC transporter permease subunit [Clostridiales bacterium]
MNTLIKYEFLKIAKKRATLIIMLVSLIITALLFGLPVLQFQTYDKDVLMKGMEGIRYGRSIKDGIDATLTDEYAESVIDEVNGLFEDPENVGNDGSERFLIGDAYWEHIAPREELMNTIASAYTGPGEYAGYNLIPELTASGAKGFNEARRDKLRAIIESPSRELSSEQKEYWLSMTDKSGVIRYGYHKGWEIIHTNFELLIFAVLACCITIAPVFAGEYQTGTDAVILAGKYGKTKLITAKITASMLFGIMAFLIHVAVAFGIPLAFFGADGWDLPLQVLGLTIPYPWTVSGAVLRNTAVILLVLIAMISLTLLLSAKMKSPFQVLSVLIPVLIVPMFFTPSGASGIFNQILFLLPYRSMVPEIGKYVSYQFGGIVVGLLEVRAVFYAVFTLALILFCRRVFKKHQVS